jgi:small subunit ribosomal protein S5
MAEKAKEEKKKETAKSKEEKKTTSKKAAVAKEEKKTSKTTKKETKSSAKKEETKNLSKKRNTRKPSRSKRRSRGGKNRKRDDKEKDPYETKILEIRRVSRMFKGGRRMRLSVFVAVGDKKGKVGLGIGKGADVRTAQKKAENQAKKNAVMVPLKGNTIPHEVEQKFKAAKIIMKPAIPGTGVVAGSSMRMIAEVAGISDLRGKILGTNNNITNAYATIEAFKKLRESRL